MHRPLTAACSIALVLLAAAPSLSAKRASTPASRPRSAVDRLVDDYFDDYFRRNPSSATSSGIHEHDRKLEDFSRAAIDSNVAALRRFERRFDAIPPGTLTGDAGADRELMLNTIRAQLLELQTIRSWEKDPDGYSSGVSQAIYVLMSRSFAPAADRLRAVIERERRIPNVFADARDNLKNPPRVYTEVAIEQLPGIIAFFQNDVPSAFRSVRDARLKSDFASTNAEVIAALRRYQSFLEKELLPRSRGDFRIGTENFRKKLLYEEMVDQPLDRLLQVGYDDLSKNQRWYQETAKKLDPKSTPLEVLHRIEKDHPAPDRLLQSFRDVLAGLRRFIVEHHIVTIPSPVMPILEETPPFARALTFASMDTPGPYERVAKEGYFNVTLPEKNWPKEQIEGHMGGFNRGTIISTAIHEAFPGHYVQFLWVQRIPSKVRKLTGCGSNAEGWAHYTEQMMLDEGYGNGDLKLRLGQLQDALLRNARYIVGIQMHTGRMTFDQAVDFFVREGYQTRAVAMRETKRGTSDPTYLVYTLGKLEILKLREDYRKLRGGQFKLQEFHDRFLQQGYPPIKIVRRALLGNDSPAL